MTPAPGQLQRLLVLDLDIGILALRGVLHSACTVLRLAGLYYRQKYLICCRNILLYLL